MRGRELSICDYFSWHNKYINMFVPSRFFLCTYTKNRRVYLTTKNNYDWGELSCQTHSRLRFKENIYNIFCLKQTFSVVSNAVRVVWLHIFFFRVTYKIYCLNRWTPTKFHSGLYLWHLSHRNFCPDDREVIKLKTNKNYFIFTVGNIVLLR